MPATADPIAQPYPVTREHIEAYRRDGFVQVDDVLTGDALAALRDAVATAVDTETAADPGGEKDNGVYGRIFNQKVNLWQRHESVAPFTLSSRLGDLAAKLAGRDMRVWHDQALFKAPHQDPGNPTPWHQDAPYWPHANRRDSLSIWIALKDATPENGCMTFVPGTHEAGELDAVNLGAGHLHRPNLIDLAPPRFKGVKGQSRPLKAGSATFHNGLTFHYAGANRSDETREAFVVIYTPADQTFNGESHGVTDDLGLAVGDPLDGERFPIVGRA